MNTATPTSAPRGFQSVWLVAEREVGSKLRSRAFVISTVITLLIALAAVIWGGFSAGNPSATQVAVTSATASAVEQVPGVEVTQVADREAAEALVRSGEVSAAVVEDTSTPVGMLIIAADSAPTMLVMGLSVSPPVELLEPATVDFALRYFVSIGFGIVFLLAAFSDGDFLPVAFDSGGVTTCTIPSASHSTFSDGRCAPWHGPATQ